MRIISSYRTLLPIIGLLVLRQAVAQTSPYTPKEIEPPAKKAARVQITAGPSLELYRNNEAIIRWTSNNPGGTDEHWGVVKYGTDPDKLNLTAKGHIRLNREHPYTVFRVRVPDLQPGKTYYYTVDSTGADGTDDGVKSGVHHLTTPRGA
jgi:phosphodiesterase/alkaline phosphatase D-like protein